MGISYIVDNSELVLTGQTIFGDLNVTGGTITISGLSINQIINKAYINYFDFSSNTVTNITTADTWVKLSASTTQGFTNDGLVHTNNRVTNTGTKRIFQLEGTASVAAGNNNQIHLAFFKNDILWPCSEQISVMSSSGRVNAVPLQCLIELDTTNYIEVWVKNENNTTNVTLSHLNVIVKEL